MKKLKGKHLTMEQRSDQWLYKDAYRMVLRNNADMVDYLDELLADVRLHLHELEAAKAAVVQAEAATTTRKVLKPKRYPPGFSGVSEEKKRGSF